MKKTLSSALVALMLAMSTTVSNVNSQTINVNAIEDIKVATNLTYTEGKTLAKDYLRPRMSRKQFLCLIDLWNHESHWNFRAGSTYYGPYGIPQANPGRKMAYKGDDWRTNPITQVRWGMYYIRGRYDTPCRAWNYFQRYGWY
jgi:hypothetical protein